MNVSSADIAKMTDNLVKAVAQRADLSEEQSRKAILAAFEVLKEQIPADAAQGGGNLNVALEWFLTRVGKK
jgi:uncharacterized protein (DUF2267 family)